MAELLNRQDPAPMVDPRSPNNPATLPMSDAIEQHESPSSSGQCDAKKGSPSGERPQLQWGGARRSSVGDMTKTTVELGHERALQIQEHVLELESDLGEICMKVAIVTKRHDQHEKFDVRHGKMIEVLRSKKFKFVQPELHLQQAQRSGNSEDGTSQDTIKKEFQHGGIVAFICDSDATQLIQHLKSLSVSELSAICGSTKFVAKSDNYGEKDCQRCPLSDDIMKELYTENASLKARVKGIAVLGDSLRKTQDELSQTTVKNAKLDKAVSNLQSRLHRVGCDTSVDLAEDEIFIPGHDRTFINSLICENGKLQKDLRELKMKLSGDARISYQKQSDADKDKQLQDLQKDLACKNARIVELEARDAQKDYHRIRGELEEFKTLCTILTPQTRKLQDDLEASQKKHQEVCAELADWKEKAKNMESRIVRELTQKMSTEDESRVSLSDRLKIGEEQVKQLEKENSRVTDQLREVIGMNTRWQRYNEQRETYVVKLTKTNQQQQSKITVLEQQVRGLEQNINDLNTLLQKMDAGKKKNTDAYVMSLEQQLVQKEDEVIELKEQVATLKVTLHTTEKQRGVAQRLEDKDMIETLKQQLKVYQEDFNQERKDRERLQGNNDILRHRLKESQNMVPPPANIQRFTGSSTGLRGHYYDQPQQPQPRRLIARGLPVYQDPYEASLLPSDVETDGFDVTDGSGNELNDDGDQLQCPRCPASFAVTDHSAFMHHVTICLQ
ncbi:TNFAIP3-interacting protein 2-like [Asterias rubens]|uniref:TNFAIP3-interacting protein 2-like n=1 Tax=Asterias rubens TaxID=7604 RepID=UPI001455871E|nr:TNFAIP3-interacting protein 2-like [Asterias rubens]